MINISNLDFAYQKGRPILESINCELETGHIYGLLGENGVGKTTLLKCIAGLSFPQGGSIQVLDHEPCKRNPAFLAEVFFIPEEFNMPEIKLKDYLKIYAPFYPKFDHEYFERLLHQFGLDMDVHLGRQSFGQRKKIYISFGLATNTRLLIMDEPTNALDIPSKSQFRKIISNALDDDRCFVISTHQVRDLDNLIDEIIILKEAHIALKASTAAISKRLAFKVAKEKPDQAFYAEHSLQGIQYIMPNDSGENTRLDMELLFKATILHEIKINSILQQENTQKNEHI